MNLKRVVATPAFLIVAAIAAAGLGYLWLSRRAAGTSAAQAGTVANPLTGPAEGPQVLSTLDSSGIQQQLSNLVSQVSASQATPNQETATIRDRGALAGTAFAGWDASGVTGPPGYASASGNQGVGQLPFGSTWNVLGFSNGMVELQGPANQDVWVNSRDISNYAGTGA